ncbi:transposase [Streptomyces griseofuscus]|uniref:transposase n=1 Tax=Streptomyces griseofuscus TaxID=146922 RepID=UPI003F519D86
MTTRSATESRSYVGRRGEWDRDARRDAFDFSSHFREDFCACRTARGDTLFELTDAILCEDGPVISPVDLTLLAEHRRGHGAMYDALNQGLIDADKLRKALAMLPQPKAADTRIVLAVDVSAWLRPDAPTSPNRLATRALLQPDPGTGVGRFRLRTNRNAAIQLTTPKLQYNSGGHTVIEPKKAMRARGMRSPDRAEAVLLAVYEPEPVIRRGGGLLV